VVANYNVSSLSIDIASDIPQIIGRQRRKDNLFRDTIHIYYVNNLNVVDENAFNSYQKEKMQDSNDQICLWQAAPPSLKGTALSNLNTVLEKDSNGLYLSTINGYPEINQLIIISEKYCRDVLKNQLSWFVIMSNCTGSFYSMEIQQLKDELAAVSGYWLTEDRLRKVADFFLTYPSLSNEVFEMLRNEGYNDIGYYFCQLSIDRIKANGYNTTKMNNEIAFRNQAQNIAPMVASAFMKGQVYSKKETKETLQEIYDKLGLKKTAKSTDLSDYVHCEEVKKDGLKALRIL
jgi:hypothetical protein